MKKNKISLRKANFSDIEFLWYLRNRPDVFRYFRTPRKTKWEEHINWVFPTLLGLSDKKIFIIEIQKKPIGQIRLDYQNQKEAEISIAILKEFRQRGLAKKSLAEAIKKEKRTKIFKAEVFKENLASQKLFEKLGFKLKGEKDGKLKYFYEKRN